VTPLVASSYVRSVYPVEGDLNLVKGGIRCEQAGYGFSAVNVRRIYPPELTSARRAREFVAQLLGGNSLDTLEAQVVTNELVTNAIVHGGTDVQVTVWTTEERAVRIEVGDGNTRCDLKPEAHAPDASSGRGLYLVDLLSERWGVEPKDDGKVVWATLPPPSDATI
jgi:anti-sigma regulatory factor (Ser/Thr protein kinase)